MSKRHGIFNIPSLHLLTKKNRGLHGKFCYEISQGFSMKYLTIIRHAEAHPSRENDFARCLTVKGERDAKALGSYFIQVSFEKNRQKKQLPKIDAMIASSARRTTQTASTFSHGIEYPLADIQFSTDLYHAEVQEVFGKLMQCGRAMHVAWVGHNPTIESVCAALLWNDAEKTEAEIFAPASFAVLSLEIDDWKELAASMGSLEAFASPPYEPACGFKIK